MYGEKHKNYPGFVEQRPGIIVPQNQDGLYVLPNLDAQLQDGKALSMLPFTLDVV